MKAKHCIIIEAIVLAGSFIISLIFKEKQTVIFGIAFSVFSLMFIVFYMIMTRKMEKAIKKRYPDMLFTHGYSKIAAKVAKEDGFTEIPKQIKEAKSVFISYIVSFIISVIYLIITIDVNEVQSISMFTIH